MSAKRIRKWICVGVVALGCATAAMAQGQAVRVDATPGRGLAFDPDKAMGSSMDILPEKQFETVYSETVVREGLSAGWGPITYRLNTELTISAWHWNPEGTWSDAAHKSGYFVGKAEPGGFLRKSYGYSLPHRGSTRSDAGNREYSRMDDGDAATYWKSNPYLTERYTGEADALHGQWVVVDFSAPQEISAIEIGWANPYAKKYTVEYWTGKEDAISRPGTGTWAKFPLGEVTNGDGKTRVQRLGEKPVTARFVRIRMTESSNTCDTHGSEDPRNCAGYAIAELSAGNFDAQGRFLDLVKHTPGQAQTNLQVSSTDPWTAEENIIPDRVQTGFDLFFKSGYTNKLPAMIPIAVVYANPEDAAAEVAYLGKRGYDISYVEMGEEPDGQFMTPEDYAALYVEFATALHKVNPRLKLGGPIFTGANEDIPAWPDEKGKTSWMGRFVDYLQAHGRMSDLTFVSFEHYPLTPCEIGWADLYREPELTESILKAWRDDGVPMSVPLMNTESNVSWSLTDPMQDLFAGLWLADSVGSYLTLAGPGGVYYHSPIQPEPLRPGCHAWSTYGNFVADEELKIRQHTAQYFASQLLNLDWVKHGGGEHRLHTAKSGIQDDAGHTLVTAYAVKRPDGEWSVLLVNKDPSNAHEVQVTFVADGKTKAAEYTGAVQRATFGAAEYVWHPAGAKSYAEPDGPAKRETWTAKAGGTITLPKASMTVLTGKIDGWE